MVTNNSVSLNTTSRNKLWLAAIKLPMYTVAIIPISVGSAIAFAQTQLINFPILLTFLSSAILIIAWLNISNDVFDADTGIDKNKAHSIVNLTGNKSLMFWLSNLFLSLGLSGIILINFWLQDWMVFWLILACCFLGYTYQGPPFRFGYLGLGEIICFITFGPMAISAAYYSQAQHFSLVSLATSVIIGITTSIILFCSHFHQIEDDLAAGKLSPLVRFGTKNGSIILMYATYSIFVLTFLFVIIKFLPISTLLIILSFPFAYKLVDFVNKYYDQPEIIKNSKFIAINFQFSSGIFLILAFIITGNNFKLMTIINLIKDQLI